MRYKEFSEDGAEYVPPDDINSMDYEELKQELERIKIAKQGNAPPAVYDIAQRINRRITDIRIEKSKKPINGPITDRYVDTGRSSVDPGREDENLNTIADYLVDNCKPYLEQIGYDVQYRVLYRGMATNADAIFNIHRVRLDNRQPESTSVADHNELNNYFTKKFGEPFRNSMFATASSSEAMEYTTDGAGLPRAVFPIGDFTFIWSPIVTDLYNEYLMNNKLPLGKILPTLGYQNTNLIGAIRSGNEIMIRCNTYYSVHMELLDKLQSYIYSRKKKL